MLLNLSVSHSVHREGVCQTPPQQTATAADGTHPTGMHSCFTHTAITRVKLYPCSVLFPATDTRSPPGGGGRQPQRLGHEPIIMTNFPKLKK